MFLNTAFTEIQHKYVKTHLNQHSTLVNKSLTEVDTKIKVKQRQHLNQGVLIAPKKAETSLKLLKKGGSSSTNSSSTDDSETELNKNITHLSRNPEVLNFERILKTPYSSEVAKIRRSTIYHFFFFINPKSGDNKGGLIMEKAPREKIKVKTSLWENLHYCNHIKDIFVTVCSLTNMLATKQSMAEVTKLSHNEGKVEHPFVIIGGGDGTTVPLIDDLVDFGANLNRVRFGVLPLGTFNDLAVSTGYGELKKLLKKKILKKRNFNGILEDLIIEYLRAEERCLDVWDVEVECFPEGRIRKISKKKYFSVKESMVEETDLTELRKQNNLFKKKKKKRKRYLQNRLKSKLRKIERKKEQSLQTASELEEKALNLKIKQKMEEKDNYIILGDEGYQTSFSRKMVNYCLIGNDAKLGMKHELKDTKKKLKKRSTFIWDKIKNIFHGKNSIASIIDKVEIHKGLYSDQIEMGSYTQDSIMDMSKIGNKDISNIKRLADEFRLKQSILDDESPRRRKVVWDVMSRTIFQTDQNVIKEKKTLVKRPSNLLCMNIPSYLGKDSGIWRNSKNKSPIMEPQETENKGKRVEIKSQAQDMSDGKLELVSFSKDVNNSTKKSRKVAQNRGPIQINFKSNSKKIIKTFIQVDGEYYELTHPKRISITPTMYIPNSKIRVLTNTSSLNMKETGNFQKTHSKEKQETNNQEANILKANLKARNFEQERWLTSHLSI